MDYEQRYKDALDRAKKLKENSDNTAVIDGCEQIFPELQGNEDEQMRQWIIDDIRYNMNNETLFHSEYKKKAEKAIAWLERRSEQIDIANKEYWRGYREGKQEILDKYAELEKQNKQKPVDKVEPKFKVGNWVVNKFGDSWHIDSFDKKNYQVSDGKGNYNYFSILHQDDMRLWSIEDAKDGDVLCTYECDEPKIVFVLKGTPKKHRALRYYCYYNIMYPYFESDSETGCLAPNKEDVKPATKEKRDLLFAKMKESGHEWDADKKEIIYL